MLMAEISKAVARDGKPVYVAKRKTMSRYFNS